jgi:PPP family 3-phenylpropionic acid transporter
MKEHRAPFLRLFFFMSFVWAAIVAPYSSILILKGIGATSPQIGVFAAGCSVISMICQPLWGLLSDKLGSPRKVLSVCLAVSAALFGCVMFAKNFYTAAGILFAETVFRCCAVPLLDSHTLSEISTIPGAQYSFIRMGASVFYGVLSLIYSGIIDERGAMAIVPIGLIISALAVCWGLFFAKGQWEADKNRAEEQKDKKNVFKDAAALLRDRRYIMFLCLVAIWALSTYPLYTFIIDYVTAVGGSVGDVPKIHALRCAAELPAFILVGSIGRRADAKKLMLAGMCFYLAHITGLLFANTFVWLAAVNLLAAPGFILGLTGRMRYISEITPESVRSTSIAAMGACEIGLGSVLGNLIAGFISGKYGIRSLSFVAMTAICAAIVIFLIVIMPEKKTV